MVKKEKQNVEIKNHKKLVRILYTVLFLYYTYYKAFFIYFFAKK